MHTSGGRVSITIDGVNYSARGEITLNPSNRTNTVGANQDGTLYRTVAAKARMAECSFDRFVNTADNSPLVWDERVMQAQNMQCSFVEQDGGLIHILSGASFVGDPSMNTATGEVTGLSIAAESYRTVRT